MLTKKKSNLLIETNWKWTIFSTETDNQRQISEYSGITSETKPASLLLRVF